MDNAISQNLALEGTNVPSSTIEPPKLKYCLYARKSSEAEERQALSIDSQVKEMLAIAERDSLEVIDIRRESHSAKDSGQRPVFKEILEDIRKDRFNGILTWAPDRLSRNAGDLGSLVDLMDQKILLEIRTHGQTFTNSPNEKFLLMILCSQAKLENDNKSINVKRGLKMRCEMGLWPAPAPTGYLNEKRVDRKGYVLVDPERAPIIKQMFEKVAYEHWSGRKLYHWLKFDLNFRTAAGNKNLTLSNIYLILENTFYYGVYEYPKTSGNWYTGKHSPLIDKELYDKAQERITRDKMVRGENKEFAFTRLITCGLCGSGVSAQEKYKKLKNGSTKKYIYYGCTRARDLHCKNGYIREEELVEQISKIVDTLDINKLGVKYKLNQEIERYYNFSKGVLGIEKINFEKQKNIDMRNYIKYILRDGSIIEKREVLGYLENRLIMRHKKITIVNQYCAAGKLLENSLK